MNKHEFQSFGTALRRGLVWLRIEMRSSRLVPGTQVSSQFGGKPFQHINLSLNHGIIGVGKNLQGHQGQVLMEHHLQILSNAWGGHSRSLLKDFPTHFALGIPVQMQRCPFDSWGISGAPTEITAGHSSVKPGWAIPGHHHSLVCCNKISFSLPFHTSRQLPSSQDCKQPRGDIYCPPDKPSLAAHPLPASHYTQLAQHQSPCPSWALIFRLIEGNRLQNMVPATIPNSAPPRQFEFNPSGGKLTISLGSLLPPQRAEASQMRDHFLFKSCMKQ